MVHDAAPEARGVHPLSTSSTRPTLARRVFSFLIRDLGFNSIGALGAACVVLYSAFGATATDGLRPVSDAKPEFALSDLSGASFELEALRGRLVLVHFFATWCEPCREELPALRRLVERSADTPVSVLAISVGEVDARVRRFMETLPVNFPVLLDPQRLVAKSWDVYALPTTYVLDDELTAKLVSNGEFAWDQLTIKDLHDMVTAAPDKRTGVSDHPQPRVPQQGG